MKSILRQLRKDAGLTQEKLAERLGTSLQQISRLEKGERKLSIAWAKRIADALGVAPGPLMSAAIGIPEQSQFVEDPDELALLKFWRSLDASQRALFVRMLGWKSKMNDAA